MKSPMSKIEAGTSACDTDLDDEAMRRIIIDMTRVAEKPMSRKKKKGPVGSLVHSYRAELSPKESKMR